MPDQCTEVANSGEVLLSTTDAAQIARLLRMLLPGGGSLSTMIKCVERVQQFETDGSSHDREKLKKLAQQIYVRRQARMRYFPSEYFHEPAWDMLLALYVGVDTGTRHMVSGLVTYTTAPPTTALRYLAALEQFGHVQRSQSARDGRVNFIELTEEGYIAMNRYLATMLESGNY